MNLPSLTAAAYEMHFLVGLIIALIFRRHWLSAVCIVAFGKEIADYYIHGDPDVLDLFATIVGSLVVILYRKRKAVLAFSMLLLLPAFATSQSYWDHLNKNKVSFSLSAAAGVANGVSDALQHKYSSTIFPQGDDCFLGLGRDFYDPNLSWVRKYKDWPNDTRPRYPGAKTWLVWTTDAWHLTKSVQLKTMQGAIITYRPEWKQKKWWWPLADLAIHSVAFSAGWHISEFVIVKN